ncbi:MAG TPA: hypothetical protein VH327_08305 [Gammaproteobacteria bacterium]|jgi:hypothetical protein|nr:hypothetical protein [Gammaproteobacteria bacterium]
MGRSLTLSILTCLAGLVLTAGCSSGPPGYEGDVPPGTTLADCEETNGYPPCIYSGDAPGESYDYYPDYGGSYYPGTGVVIVPEPVPVPVPAPPAHRPPPRRPPPPKHHEPPPRDCHPYQGHPCP